MNKFTVKAGDLIFKEGQLQTAMYIILNGAVEIFFNLKGREVRVATMRKGDFFGEMALFRSKPRTASARAILDSDMITVDSKQQLQLFLQKNPTFAAKMVKIMAERLAKTNEMLVDKLNDTIATEIEFKIDLEKKDKPPRNT